MTIREWWDSGKYPHCHTRRLWIDIDRYYEIIRVNDDVIINKVNRIGFTDVDADLRQKCPEMKL